ncbi:YraN family protein [Actinomyces marmotae]|uniref:YraN family protein n=1 Tax=Actinomyces marmotae TaxID=2737173 RepID=UPI0013588EF8|nr:YraN family protein [Actinomyces marmotae]
MTPTNPPIPAPPAARLSPPIPPAAREAPPAAPPSPAERRRLTGQRGEGIAADYLRDSGWRILDRNWRAPAGSGLRGELDIIAEDPAGALVIVEVKTRSSLRAGPPAAAVTPPKEARLRRLAIAWAGRRGAPPHRLRLDVVSVILREGAPALLRHHRAVCGS